MKLVIEKPVTVITPTIGSPKLKDAIESVAAQTYGNVRHLVIIDGPEYKEVLHKNVQYPETVMFNKLDMVTLPYNTGKVGEQSFYGHRIYATYPHLINSDYILFLDEDNWYQPDHVASLVETIETQNLDFAYSLRQIYNTNKEYLCDDNCESLGKWEIYMSRNSPHGKHYLIDTSSFCFKREFIKKTCHYWHWGWGGDRHFFYSVKDTAKYHTNGKHTLCYRLDGNPNSVNDQFFKTGNAIQEQYYGGKYPWIKN